MQPETDDEATVQKTIALYNRLRSPEINAKLIFFSPYLLTVSFTGGFCYGCGVLQYIEGFAEQYKILSGKGELKIGKTRQVSARVFEADFTLKSK